MREGTAPFHFMVVSSLVRLTGRRAETLAELLEQAQLCSDASVFFHTFQSLEQHHFLTEGFSNDFAQWTLAACNEPQLAEQLASLDIRHYESLAALRGDLVSIIESFLERAPESGLRRGFEPFYFCEAATVAVPSPWRAATLKEFCEALRHVSIHTVYYHFVAARLREPLTVNDFSFWLEDNLGLKELADPIYEIYIYTNTH